MPSKPYALAPPEPQHRLAGDVLLARGQRPGRDIVPHPAVEDLIVVAGGTPLVVLQEDRVRPVAALAAAQVSLRPQPFRVLSGTVVPARLRDDRNAEHAAKQGNQSEHTKALHLVPRSIGTRRPAGAFRWAVHSFVPARAPVAVAIDVAGGPIRLYGQC